MNFVTTRQQQPHKEKQDKVAEGAGTNYKGAFIYLVTYKKSVYFLAGVITGYG